MTKTALHHLFALALLGWLCGQHPPLHASEETRSIMASEATRPIRLDGILDEPDWETAIPAGTFYQQEPLEGEEATCTSIVRVLLGPDGLYVAARLEQTVPVDLRRTPRDDLSSTDRFTVEIDGLHDHRSGAMFAVSAANVQADGRLSEDIKLELEWDGVWQSAVSTDDWGWTVELHLPLSTLRTLSTALRWGINFRRDVSRLHESSAWVITPRIQTARVSRFGHLSGLAVRHNEPRLELSPYAVLSGVQRRPLNLENPFFQPNSNTTSAGLDWRLRLSPKTNLNGTLNPDWSQVEADPASVNLTTAEITYSEKRPFFLESLELFRLESPQTLFGSLAQSAFPRLFYARRIGRPPHLDVPADADFAEETTATTILAAVQATSQLQEGTTVAILDALTAKEQVEAQLEDGSRETRVAEPLTNYSVAGLTRQMGDRNTVLTLVVTNTLRDLPAQPEMLELHRSALTAGAALRSFPFDRKWALEAMVAGSQISGTPEALLRTQTSPAHYFQRPDATHLGVDPSASVLKGWAGQLSVARQSGVLIGGTLLNATSPGLEVNDLGQLGRSDRVTSSSVVGWQTPRPGQWLRSWNLQLSRVLRWNFGGDLVASSWTLTNHFTTLRYLTATNTAVFRLPAVSDDLARGGPRVMLPGGGELSTELETDAGGRARGKLKLLGYSLDGNGSGAQVGVSLITQPWPLLRLSLEPSVRYSADTTQYVYTADDPAYASTYGKRYVFAGLTQLEYQFVLRVDVNLRPELGLQLYAQALSFDGDYDPLKTLAVPNSFQFNSLGESSAPYDFHLWNVRHNLILRWEVRPGSLLYLVWSGQRQRDTRLATQAGSSSSLDAIMLKLSFPMGR